MEGLLDTETIVVESGADSLVAREIDSPGTPTAKFLAGAIAIAFLMAGGFFAVMPTEQSLAENWWMRAILSGGLILIGVAVLWSTFTHSDKVTEIKLDARKRMLTYGKRHDSGAYTNTGSVPLASIRQFFAGSQSDHNSDMRSTTVLYIDAEGGPKNGSLMVGSVGELEELARFANLFLKQHAGLR